VSIMEETMARWQAETNERVFLLIKEAVDSAGNSNDVVKQKYCASHFGISVNTLKEWVAHGCPEIRLESGMVFYSKKAVHDWLLTYQSKSSP